jgi:hypothetical protein
MGAGCYYKHEYPFNDNLAAWIELDELDSDQYSFIYQSITGIIVGLGYEFDGEEFKNGLYKIELKSTYYGDGLIVYFKNRRDEYINLAIRNFDSSENKVLKALHKNGYKLRVATGGYSSKEYIPE